MTSYGTNKAADKLAFQIQRWRLKTQPYKESKWEKEIIIVKVRKTYNSDNGDRTSQSAQNKSGKIAWTKHHF